MKRFIFLSIVLLSLTLPVRSSEIWVSATGKDSNPGTVDAPKATLTMALRQAREWRRTEEKGIENGIDIILKEGSYLLHEALFVRPEDSGTAQSPTVIKGETDKEIIISGGITITGWKKSGKLWFADAPHFNGRPLEFRQLWVNGRKAVRARDVIDFEKMHRIRSNDPANEVLWIPAESVKKIQKAPYAEMVLHQMWCVSFLRIRSIDVQGDSAAVRFHQPESRIQFEHPWPRPVISTNGNSAFYLTNAPELLDQKGEWYLDIDKRKVYYYPLDTEKINESEIISPALETLVRVEGTLDRPVTHISFENISFSHTTWQRPSTHGHVPLQAGMYLTDAYRLRPQMIRNYNNHKLDNQGWLGRQSAAVELSGTAHIDFVECNFTQLGASGLDYVYGNRGGRVEGCLFQDIGSNGLVVGSFSPPSHETHVPYDPADSREVCRFQQISNNLFNNVANEDWGCVAILAGYVADINIEHNEISEVPYSGISLGWGWTRTVNCMRNNRVHANHIHHYARHMYDVAGIYTLGAQPKSEITENAVHSIYTPSYVHDPKHWFYLYTDEGSSYIEVKNNWTEGEKYLQNANGPGNTWTNNGPQVDAAIREKAGLQAAYRYLLDKVKP